MPLVALLLAKLAAAAARGHRRRSLAAPAAPGRLSLLVAIGMPAAGFLLPDALLERRREAPPPSAARRPARCARPARRSARRPAASPPAGFAEIARGGDGPLAEELRVTVAEISCGLPPARALRSLRERVPGSEVAALCAAIERSRSFGSPLADQLRRQSASLRRDQRRAVEEHAARAAPKIQLVVALVLVPSVLLMIAAGLIANADVLLGGF